MSWLVAIFRAVGRYIACYPSRDRRMDNFEVTGAAVRLDDLRTSSCQQEKADDAAAVRNRLAQNEHAINELIESYVLSRRVLQRALCIS